MKKDPVIVPPFVRSPFNYDRRAASDEVAIRCDDPSRAIQSMRDETDINVIVDRFGLTGKLPNGVNMPEYGDFEGIYDYQSALNLVIEAEKSFMQLPAHVRSRFHNSPQALLQFVGDEANREEAIRLGVIPKPPEPQASAPADSPAPAHSAT